MPFGRICCISRDWRGIMLEDMPYGIAPAKSLRERLTEALSFDHLLPLDYRKFAINGAINGDCPYLTGSECVVARLVCDC